jgi:signal peptidase
MGEGWLKEITWILISILLVAGLNYGLRFVMHTDSPLVIVISGSMEPVFYPGDVVLTKGVSPDDVHVGDVVIYKQPYLKYPVIHRVRSIGEITIGNETVKCFVTWGDNNERPDFYEGPNGILPCVPAYAVESKAVMVFPKIGYPSLWLREHIFG